MVHFWQIILLPSFLLNIVKAVPSPLPSNLAIHTIYEFPNETWIENIAVSSNGNLLLNLLSTPQLYQLQALNPVPGSAKLLYTFPYATGLTGIAEIQPDVFAVLAGNWSIGTFSTTPGSWSVWKVDFRRGRKNDPAVSKITDLTKASFANGMTLLTPGSPYLLIADSVLGVVWRLDYLTSEYEIILESPLMLPPPGPIVLGINGIHVFDSSVYFTNSFQGLFARVPVELYGPDAGSATGDYVVVANNGPGDDFAFDKEGNAYITQDPSDALELVTRKGMVTVLAGNVNSTILEGDTAASFGRTKWDENVLYVVTNGGIAGAVKGTQITGGKVLAVDVKALLSS
ncbi:uncharacterized protein K444DRAFT_656650 [Hyaloscypha bicolor E]|uniref:SMP-30/Gluconolactonase/LRE-like region domain-containing protein n=1 Tax=Hyaloscypha bicolor E TaxID=1095630 RepID=A0A2J6SKH4_9HELO|nr:uncharacterized protein K444DRAFT_656650 [Hyaloscypha bicolor E]PMD51278.1 hypothetical protein K444DRAFT_656650 [Hyaloscypha bicolor E]